MSFLYLFLYP